MRVVGESDWILSDVHISRMEFSMEQARPYLDKTNPSIYKALVKAVAENREAAKAAGVSVALMELVNVRVSELNACATCLSVHHPAALKAGVSQVKLDVLSAWRDSSIYTAEERAALEIAESLTVLDPALDRNALAQRVSETLSTDQIAVIEWTATLINTFNRISIASGHPVRDY